MNKLFIFLLMGVFMISLSSAVTNFTNSSRMYYSFDLQSSLDLSGNGITGTINNGYLQEGVLGRGLFLDPTPSGSSVSFNTPLNGSTPFTLSAWVNPKSVSSMVANSNRFILSIGSNSITGGGVNLYINSSGHVNLDSPNLANIGILSPTVTINSWNHLLALNNGSTMFLYLNNVNLLNSTAISVAGILSIISNGQGAISYIGNRSGVSQANQDWIDEVGVWNRTLTSQEINALFNRGVAGNPFRLSSLSTPPFSTITQNASHNFTGGFLASTNFSVANATLFIWNGSGIFNQTTRAMRGDSNSTSINVTLSNGFYQWNYFVCQNKTGTTNCSFAFENNTLIKGFLINQESFNNPVLEGSTQSFILNITLPSGNSISSAKIHYNHTDYNGSFALESGTTYRLSRDILLPLVSADINKSFYWNVTFSTGQIQTSANNQQINNFNIDDCSVQTQLIVNYSVFDEDTLAYLLAGDNITIRALAIFTPLGGTTAITFNKTYTGVSPSSPARICISSNGLAVSNFTMDLTTSYISSLHEPEFQNFQNRTVNTNTIPFLIDLYDLLTTNAQQFQIIYRDSNFLAVPDVVVDIQRQYLGLGGFLSIESPKTGNDGKTVASFVLNDEVYNIYIKQQNQIIASFLNNRAFCQPTIESCKIELNERTGGSQLSGASLINGVLLRSGYNLTTNIFSTIFTVADSSTKTLSLNISVYDAFLNNSICTNIVIGSSGTLSCTIPSNFLNQTAIAKIYIDGVTSSTSLFYTGNGANFGNIRFILALGLFLTIVGIGVGNKAIVGISIIVALFLMGALYIADSGGILAVFSSFIFIAILVIILIARGNKGGTDAN